MFLHLDNVAGHQWIKVVEKFQSCWKPHWICWQVKSFLVFWKFFFFNFGTCLTGTSFDTLLHLEFLNLSGNSLTSLKDVTNLARVSKLKDLILKVYQCQHNVTSILELGMFNRESCC